MAKTESKRDPNALYCDEPTLTVQAHAGDCDINEIIRRSQIAGGLPISNKVAQYGDFTQIPSTHEAFEFVRLASEAFMTLDWKLRERFDNSPQKMIDFLNDANNRDEAVKLGLVNAPQEAAAAATPPVGGAASAQPAQ